MMRKGEIYECRQCSLRIQVLEGSQFPPLQLAPPRCICGELLILLQSGSESVQDARDGVNKIVDADVPAHTH
ncbi:MAG TPA: hypothetical protein VEJ63_21115 [Planctomycetota bacterium]|nr:hypothetical protein [Planctomycetota bacterium]